MGCATAYVKLANATGGVEWRWAIQQQAQLIKASQEEEA